MKFLQAGKPAPQLMYVRSAPYPWPWNGDLRPANTTLIVIDMQTDFCGKGGYIDGLGYDINITRACIAPIQRLLEKLRGLGYPIMHTREGHRADLSDLPANKRWRSRQTKAMKARGSATLWRPGGSRCRAGRAWTTTPSFRLPPGRTT